MNVRAWLLACVVAGQAVLFVAAALSPAPYLALAGWLISMVILLFASLGRGKIKRSFLWVLSISSGLGIFAPAIMMLSRSLGVGPNPLRTDADPFAFGFGHLQSTIFYFSLNVAEFIWAILQIRSQRNEC